MRLSTEKWAYVGFGATIFLLGTVGVVSYHSTLRFIETTEWVAHTQDILDRLNGLMVSLVDAETGQRGFLLTGEDRSLEPYTAALTGVRQQVAELRALASETPTQRQELDILEKRLDALLAELRETIDMRRRQGPQLATDRSAKGKKLMDEVRGVIRNMGDEEKA
jgi:CHASE3 domain sensor protein